MNREMFQLTDKLQAKWLEGCANGPTDTDVPDRDPLYVYDFDRRVEFPCDMMFDGTVTGLTKDRRFTGFLALAVYEST